MSPETWARCRPWLLPALEAGDGDETDLRNDILAGRAQLWAADEGAMVTQCVDDGAERTLHVWLAGGRLTSILALREGLEAWARGLGCEAITIEGRSGWARVLGAHGYRRRGKFLRRSL